MTFEWFSEVPKLHSGDWTYSVRGMEQAGREKGRRKLRFFIQKLD